MSYSPGHEAPMQTNSKLPDTPDHADHPRRSCITATWSWQTNSSYILFSPELRQILLHDDHPDAMSLAQCLRLVHHEDRADLRELYTRIRSGSYDPFDCIFRMRRRDLGWCWILCTGSVAQAGSGTSRQVSGAFIDVSRLRVHSKFQHHADGVGDANYHALLENSEDVMVRLDQELFPLYVNPATFRYFARSPQQVFDGSDTAETLDISTEHIAFVQRNVTRVFETGSAVRETTSFTTAGKQFSGEYSFWPEFDTSGKVVSVMSQFRDMTERMRLQKQAQLNTQRLNALYQLTQMDSAPEDEVIKFVLHSMSTLTNSEGGFIFIPDGEIEGPGCLYRQTQGLHLVDSRLPSELFDIIRDEHGQLHYRCIKNGDGVTPVSIMNNGTLVVMRCTFAPVIENNRLACLAGVRNKPTDYDESDLQQIETFLNGVWIILGRLRYMRALHQAKEAAEVASRAKALFVSHINHELRTPLTSILGYAETMSELAPDEEASRARCLEVILRHARQMHDLVADLLSLSRLENDDIPLTMEPLLLRRLAEKTAHSMQAQFETKDLELKLDIAPSLQVSADGHFLAQVFRNLLENAVHYAHRDTVIEISARQERSAVRVSVSDQGARIAANDLPKLFERFYRGKQPSSEHKGTGIGLSICKHVVERHGGRIWVENTPLGVRMCFTLPSAAGKTKG